jgi:hypothetical protein
MADVLLIPDPYKRGKEFKSRIMFDGKSYETSVFFAPIPKGTPEYKKIVNKISSRKQLDKTTGQYVTCLGITKSEIKESLDDVVTSIYLFVNEKGKATSDQASGSLQILETPNTSSAGGDPVKIAYICDLCRNCPDPSKKSASSPVKPIMHLFEQLAHYIFGETDICLLVDHDQEDALVPLYEKYGFSRNPGHPKYIFMKKAIVPDPTLSNFPFDPTSSKSRKKSHSKISKGGKSLRRRK